ncbi:hypothetical protein MJ904_22770 [Massilia sp. MB5]|uniref:PilC/PilY family type IV pilus protein n=1 Tax=Massilia sp. MB5 TaxID=2919578 RepID=UPI001F0CF436|nr:PilC/PilY family type IV pilus protein [Massilia sp. MB5]UMR29827.1 hypothetical protein MJ904_22770 [Massilia sp. MB5]
MKISTALAALCAAVSLASLLPLPAAAAPTNIAQVPLLNISGTGTVKPNLMLLFDNSGSMEQSYTPDYVNDSLCRSRAQLSSGTTACTVGHPPFMSADFNRQYYNPALRYQPPIKWDGTFYQEQTAGNTSNWTNVVSDGFNVLNTDLYGNSDTAINLVTGYPDLQWCDPSNTSDCKRNTATYNYPDNTYRNASAINVGPYYYTIGVAEFCTDDSMVNCKSTSAGAAAPTGYPVPVKVRWCNSTALTSCQAKRVGSFIYPRYSQATGAIASYGTIAIGASKTTSSLNITSVVVNEGGTNRTVTNSSVTASTGTDTALKQQTVASALAASIVARTSVSNAYYACVRTPLGQPSVPACSTFGITLAADNVVAVVPVTCTGSKSLATCQTINDNTRAGWGITVNTSSVTFPSTALMAISGTTADVNPASVLASLSLGGTTIASNITIGRNANAATAVSRIVSAIGTGGTYRAYTGGNTITPTCQAASATTVCIVVNGSTSSGSNLTAGSQSSKGTMAFSFTPTVASTDNIPTTVVALSAGSAAPSTFVRVNIVSGSTYPKSSARSDCTASAGVCTYNEEMTNFANWYSYYKTRLQMMKTSVGIAFSAVNSNYRVGYVRLSSAGAAGAIDQKPADFTGTARSTWYSNLYNTSTSGSTPSRPALDSVGKMFANQAPYNYASGQEVVQFPCQQNFTILTTDGYWNGGSAASVANNDNVESSGRFCLSQQGCVDSRAQTQPSLADVALYWYNGGSSTSTVSLRPSLEDMSKEGQVPAGPNENTHLHMNTYTLGLGMDGIMTYEANYDTAAKAGGDFYNLITAASSGCPWNSGGAYVWPDPQTSSTANTVQERVDDLWHTAINGHGKYFSANEPKEVVEGLQAALAKMQISTGAAAAAATSTPNISQEDSDIFSDTFTTVKWYGELAKRKIDVSTGEVSANTVWVSTNILGTQVLDNSRKIYKYDGSSSTPEEFTYDNLDATERSWFDNKCAALSQCTLLDTTKRAIVNDGRNLVAWLRGAQQYSDDEVFRAYSTTVVGGTTIPIVLGDIASSKPAYMREPRKSYTISDYDSFKNSYADRAATVFTAANDGMLHAFDAADGRELWAYMPRITMKKLYALASTTYGTNHQFTTDGAPELGDVYFDGAWHTIMVAGLNAGGRGFYALDVTNAGAPKGAKYGQAPKVLWELCADSSICSRNDPDIGLTFGNPQFGMWNNRWVVYLTSGYNNIPGVDGINTGSGEGILYIVDVKTGEILAKQSTGSGNVTTPSGLARITAITNDPAGDPVTTYIYGGDNLGQFWRFDLTKTLTTGIGVRKMGSTGTTQPITTRPDVTLCEVKVKDSSGIETSKAQRVVLFGTGRLLDVPDTTNTDVQSLYLLKDVDADTSTINVRGSGMVEQTLSRRSGGTAGTSVYDITKNAVDLNTKSGWFFDWKLNAGERMNLDPKIVSGAGNVVTNIPTSSSSCSVGGTSNAYQVDVCKGTSISDNPVGSTLSNTSAAVGFIIIRLPKGELKMITTTAKGETLTRPLSELDSAGAHRVGWRRVKGE